MTQMQTVTSGPGKWELLQSMVQMLDPQSTIVHVTFTLSEGKKEQRGGRITCVREADAAGRSREGYVEIEGYLFEGRSPYQEHGTSFSGSYNPTTRSGYLNIKKKK